MGYVVGLLGVEPSTSASSERRSNLVSYRPAAGVGIEPTGLLHPVAFKATALGRYATLPVRIDRELNSEGTSRCSTVFGTAAVASRLAYPGAAHAGHRPQLQGVASVELVGGAPRGHQADGGRIEHPQGASPDHRFPAGYLATRSAIQERRSEHSKPTGFWPAHSLAAKPGNPARFDLLAYRPGDSNPD